MTEGETDLELLGDVDGVDDSDIVVVGVADNVDEGVTKTDIEGV